jgi:hypothetical protein
MVPAPTVPKPAMAILRGGFKGGSGLLGQRDVRIVF